MKRIWMYLSAYKKECVFAPLFKMLEALFELFVPLVVSAIIDTGIGNADKGYIVKMSLLLVTLAVIGLTCAITAQYFAAKAAVGCATGMRHHLFKHIQSLSFTEMNTIGTSTLITRMTSDINQVQNGVNLVLRLFLRSPFIVFGAMIMAFTIDVKAALVFAVAIPVLAVIVFGIMLSTRPLYKKVQAGLDKILGITRENLTGVRVVRAFGRENFEIERFDEKNNAFSELWIRLGHMMTAYWSTGDLITALQVLTVIAVGTVSAVNGEITLGEFLAFVSYNATLNWPVRALGKILAEMSKTGVSISRISYILHAQPEQDPPEALTPPMDRDICFEHVTFGYENQKPVLDDVSFTIPAGKTFAILGGTGSGKTTLMHLLNRLYDLEEGGGRITIGGVDINQISRAHLRKNVSIVLQEPFLFSRTIRENIGIACPEKDSERMMEYVRKAARSACVDEAIESFTNGYETVVGERGVTLSGGQKQRVAIARMLTQNAPVMIFDDSLSAVDAETDAKIRQELKEKMGSATIILISHRITTLMQADQILVLDQGKVADIGTHEQLISREGIYQDIYQIQMNNADRELLRQVSEEQPTESR